MSVWDNALSILELDSRINKVGLDSILKKIKTVKEDDGFIVLSCRDEYSMSIAKEKTMTNYIEGAIRTVTDKPYKVSFVIEGDEKALTTSTIAERKVQEKTRINNVSAQTNLSDMYTFENFVVGNCNRFAQAASVRVADKPGQTQYNPLYLWGNSGLGKTHLMQAIGNRIVQNYPNKRVIYTTCENFTNEYISTIKSKDYDSFRNLYRNVDVLMIDDIQFLIGKEGVQEEFFNTFESLINSGKQIVITSDKAPNNLVSLDERLTSRFQNGYTMDVQPPDFETRKAILISKLEIDSIQVSDEVLNYICENATSNIRQINGACNILASFFALSNEVVQLSQVESMLHNFISPKKAQQATPELIMSIVSQYYGIGVDKMKSKLRSKEVLTARSVAMYMLRELLDMQLNKIGQFFGGRDHATVINSLNKVSNDDDLLRDIEEIKKSLGVEGYQL